jgi:hypothetical protein
VATLMIALRSRPNRESSSSAMISDSRVKYTLRWIGYRSLISGPVSCDSTSAADCGIRITVSACGNASRSAAGVGAAVARALPGGRLAVPARCGFGAAAGGPF